MIYRSVGRSVHQHLGRLAGRSVFPSVTQCSSPATTGQNSMRHYSQSSGKFFMKNFMNSVRHTGMTDELQRKMNQGEPVAPQHLQEYVDTMPDSRIARLNVAKWLEQGWQKKTIPVNETSVRLYLSTAAYLKRLDSVNLSGLLQMLNKEMNPQDADAFLSRAMNNPNMASFQGGISAMPYNGAGQDPSNPLHMVQVPPKGDRFFNILRLLLFAGVSFALLSALFGSLGDASGGGGPMSVIGKSPVHIAENPDKKFSDEIVAYLKDPAGFTRLGGKMPRGVLLTGKPGTGKTLLAKAVAGESGVPFIFAMRKLFDAARERAPCIIFIDEIDAVGAKRSSLQLDGFEDSQGIVVMAATNLADILDPALTRPGRLDKVLDVPLPDIRGREEILDLYSAKIVSDDTCDFNQIARGTPGFSGAELENLVNQAAIQASKLNHESVSMEDLEWARDKVMMGPSRESAIISEDSLEMTAFHEGGHALVALKTPDARIVHKATVMPRGRALGMVMSLPDGDQNSMSKAEMLAFLDEIKYGTDRVTSAMVTEYGLSDKVGVMTVDDKVSAETSKLVDEEVRRLLNEAYERAKKLLTESPKELETIAHGLLEYEALAGAELVDLLAGKQPHQDRRKRKQGMSRPFKDLPTQPAGERYAEKEKKRQMRNKSSSNENGGSGNSGIFSGWFGGSKKASSNSNNVDTKGSSNAASSDKVPISVKSVTSRSDSDNSAKGRTRGSSATTAGTTTKDTQGASATSATDASVKSNPILNKSIPKYMRPEAPAAVPPASSGDAAVGPVKVRGPPKE
eukprot:GSChrysophyteH1.ASY1.ANO1.2491.1 assembled CDS